MSKIERSEIHRIALGKGLDALIPEFPKDLVKPEKNSAGSTGLVQIRMNKIKPNPYQPRGKFDKDKMEELTSSIKEKGIIQPVVVRPVGDEFELVVGERRFLAAQKLGMEKLPALVMEKLSKEEMLELSLIENLQREDLNPIDEAKAYRRLLEECGLSQKKLSERIGKDRSSIANTLRLLNLPKAVQGFIANGQLSEGHARAILSLSDEKERIALSRHIIKDGLSVRKTEELVYGRRQKAKRRKLKRASSKFLEIENSLKQFFGTKVKIVQDKKRGKIEIEFYSDEDLSRILELLHVNL
ncbi:MAG: ParB/RepB/Spo0J family partition protein [candidate division Zixibacteria bacterium]|nr:ParB/RepB/Spo0J family partition protein [candidate division Zixibacteria bacterium]